MTGSPRNKVFLCGDPAPDGTLTCPRCAKPDVYLAWYTNEPTCDDEACGWTASEGGWPETAA
jgi:hypothetical protein